MTQFNYAGSGSTIINGTVACSSDVQQSGSTGSCEAYELLSGAIKAGSYINNNEVLEFMLEYNGKKFDSQPKNSSESTSGLKGWMIAVIVVGSIVGVILTIIIITCIVKKVKKNKE